MKTFPVALVLLLTLPAVASAQTISGHVYDHYGDPLAGIVVAYNLAGYVQDDTTAADGAYLLSFDTSGVPDEGTPQARITTWGKLKVAFSGTVGVEGKAATAPRAVVFPDTLYFLGGANYWSNTHPLPAPTADVTVNMALPPTIYTDIPTEGPIPICPADLADFHNLLNAPCVPQTVSWCRLWHPDRIRARIGIDIRPEWNEAEYRFILGLLLWQEQHQDIRAVYGMDSLYALLPRGSTTAYTPGIWRIRKGDDFSCAVHTEFINGDYYGKHAEITLQYADSMGWLPCLHEFTHGYEALINHVQCPNYNGNGSSVMNVSASGVCPADKAYTKLAYQLQKLRLVDGKHDGSECFYCIGP